MSTARVRCSGRRKGCADLTRAQRLSIALADKFSPKESINMKSQSKTFVLALVLVGTVAWTAVETFRVVGAQQREAQAESVQRSVETKLAGVRAKQQTQVAGSADATAAPDTK